MTTWETFLVAFGGNAILLAALAWLARSVLQHWLTKDVEGFKSDLAAEASRANEKLRHELSMSALEHQVRYSRLYERRAQVIAETYEKLVAAYWAFESFTSPFEWGGEPSKLEKYKNAMSKSTEYFKYFDSNRIYLPAELCQKIEDFMQSVRKESVSFGVWLQMEQESSTAVTGKEKFEAWMKAAKFFESEAPKARALLEDELRRIIGP
jgi:hypothetical protein